MLSSRARKLRPSTFATWARCRHCSGRRDHTAAASRARALSPCPTGLPCCPFRNGDKLEEVWDNSVFLRFQRGTCLLLGYRGFVSKERKGSCVLGGSSPVPGVASVVGICKQRCCRLLNLWLPGQRTALMSQLPASCLHLTKAAGGQRRRDLSQLRGPWEPGHSCLGLVLILPPFLLLSFFFFYDNF